MALEDLTIGVDEICKACGWSARYLKNNWLSLHLEEGFPRKLPSGMRWPRSLVEDWITSGGATQCQTTEAGELRSLLTVQKRRLQQRYGGRAA